MCLFCRPHALLNRSGQGPCRSFLFPVVICSGYRVCLTLHMGASGPIGGREQGWRVGNGESEAEEVSKEVELPSAQAQEMDNLALLLQKDTGWTKNAGSVDAWFTEKCEQYCGDLVDAELTVPTTHLLILLSYGVRLCQNMPIPGSILFKPSPKCRRHYRLTNLLTQSWRVLVLQ